MRKYLFYTLIFVLLFGFFIPKKAEAVDCENFSFTFKIDYRKTNFVGGAIIDRNESIFLITTITNNNSWYCNGNYTATISNWLVNGISRPEYNNFAYNLYFDTSGSSSHSITSHIALGNSVSPDYRKDVPIWRGVSLKTSGLYGNFDKYFGNDRVVIAYRPPEPLHGGWSAWSACSARACGSTGTQTRTCTKPSPLNGGLTCTNPANPVTRGGATTRSCTARACNTPPKEPEPPIITTIPPEQPPIVPPVQPTPITPIEPQESLKDPSYHLLEPLLGCTEETKGCVCTGDEPNKICKLETFDPTGEAKLGGYLNIIIKLIIGLCAVAAVVMIVVGGIEYITSELISSKESAKEKIRNAIFGLVLALGSYAILFTINPDLLITDVEIAGVTLDVALQEYLVLKPDGTLTSSIPGRPVNPNLFGGACDPTAIMRAATAGGAPINQEQANALACLAGAEKGTKGAESNCDPVPNYRMQRGEAGFTAFGPWQILLITHSKKFENPVCWSVPGVTRPISCNLAFKKGVAQVGTPAYQNCIKAAGIPACSAATAGYVIKEAGNSLNPWTTDYNIKGRECHTSQRKCARRHNVPVPQAQYGCPP